MYVMVADLRSIFRALCERVHQPRRTRNVDDNPKNGVPDDSDRPEQLEYG